jgi:hypothetical protein
MTVLGLSPAMRCGAQKNFNQKFFALAAKYAAEAT